MSGCGTMFLVMLVIVVVIALLPTMGSCGNGGEITKSTIERKPLDKSLVTETAYFKDDLNWIFSASTLENGMAYFYSKTGVQPFLYITDNIDGDFYPSNDAFDAFAHEFYDEQFSDEAHFLVIFKEYNERYNMWYVAGSAAKSVMDDEAVDILFDYIEQQYYTDAGDEEMFGNAFRLAADRIMFRETSPWPVIVVVAAIAVVVFIAAGAHKSNKAKKEAEAKRMEEMLSKPLETFGETELSDLEQKYKDQ